MKRLVLIAVAAAVCVGIAGCYSTPVMPPGGWAIANIKAPLSADNFKVSVETTKTGLAMVENYLGLISIGDCSIETAAKQGGIKTIEYADYEYFNVLGVYQKFTIKLHGN